MKLTDGKKTINITMNEWNGSHYTPDWSNDFFQSGGLKTVWVDAIDDEAHQVQDVDYCAEQAEDWAAYRGDFYDPDAEDEDRERGIERCIDVEILHET